MVELPCAVPGLRYVPEYLSCHTHDRLLAEVETQPWHAMGDQRRIQFYGYWYDHAKGGLYRIGNLPGWADELASCLVQDGLMPCPADQLIVSEYAPGQGIRPHVDAPVFADVIVGISLGSPCIMELIGEGAKKEEVLLEPRSAVVLSGPRSADLAACDSGTCGGLMAGARLTPLPTRIPDLQEDARASGGEGGA